MNSPPPHPFDSLGSNGLRIYRSLLLVFGLAAFVQFAAAETHELSIDIHFPDKVAGLPLSQRIEFPQKELGVNLAYQREGEATRGSVYLYNGGLKLIPDGIKSTIVQKHFAQVIGEVKQMETLGRARAVILSGADDQATSYSGCGPQFLWREYDMELQEVTLTSYTYLTAMRNNFVKLRVSFRKGDPRGSKEAAQFVREIRKVLGACK